MAMATRFISSQKVKGRLYMHNDFEVLIDPQDPEDTGTQVSMHAGFPNAAEDRGSNAGVLDFNKLLIRHPSSTYCFRVQGNAYEDRGIFNGDIAVIDRALTPRPSDLVIYFPQTDFVICQYKTLKRGTEV